MRLSTSLLPAASVVFSCAAPPPTLEDSEEHYECMDAEYYLHKALKEQPCDRTTIRDLLEVFQHKCRRVSTESVGNFDLLVAQQFDWCRRRELEQDECNAILDGYKETLEHALQNDPCKLISDARQQVDAVCTVLLSREQEADINRREIGLREKCDEKELADIHNALSPPSDKCKDAAHQVDLALIAKHSVPIELFCDSDAFVQLRKADNIMSAVCTSDDFDKTWLYRSVRLRSNIANIWIQHCARSDHYRQRR